MTPTSTIAASTAQSHQSGRVRPDSLSTERATPGTARDGTRRPRERWLGRGHRLRALADDVARRVARRLLEHARGVLQALLVLGPLHPRDDQPLDLGRALEDLVDLGVPEPLLERDRKSNV